MKFVEPLIDALRPLRFRGKVRLLQRLVPRSGQRTSKVFGYQMRLDLGEFIQRMIYLGAYERQETSLVLRWLQPGMTFVDVGANIGYYSLLAASRIGSSGRIYAIEPSPVAAEKLMRTATDNDIANLHIVRVGCGDRTDEVMLFVPPGDNHSPTMLETNWPSVRVPVLPLDDLLDEWAVAHVDLLKMDVEGYEPRVLAGSRRALARGAIRAILCEFNDPWLRIAGTSSEELYKALQAWGFRDICGVPRSLADRTLTRFLVHK